MCGWGGGEEEEEINYTGNIGKVKVSKNRKKKRGGGGERETRLMT